MGREGRLTGRGRRACTPASQTKCKVSNVGSYLATVLLATGGRATRQRPRLLLGRSVYSPHFNVALRIFHFSACPEAFVFTPFFLDLFNQSVYGGTSFPDQSQTFPLAPDSSFSMVSIILSAAKSASNRLSFVMLFQKGLLRSVLTVPG